MRKGLFLLYEGIGDTIFNSQVALHVNEMKSFNVDMDILTFETNKKAVLGSKENLLRFKNKYPEQIIYLRRGINIFYPVIHLLNCLLFLNFILKNRGKYTFIHARADYATFIALITKPFHGIPVYWDCRGHTEAEIKHALSFKSSIIRIVGFLYILPAIRVRNTINTKFSDKVVFVSDALCKIFKNSLKTRQIFVIPCPVSEKRFYFSEKDRTRLRADLKYDRDDTVFIYSGSMVKYQYLEGLILYFKQIMLIRSNKVLILTKDTSVAQKVFSTLKSNDQLLITSADFDEVNRYYNAADIGVLIREDDLLNYVASPTKHGEYCLSGLIVALNDTVDQAKKFSLEIGNYANVSNLEICKNENSVRHTISSNAKRYFARTSLNLKYIDLYTC